MRPLRLGLLQGALGGMAGLEGWLAQAAGKADLLVLPEYACCAPQDEDAATLLPLLRATVRRHGMWLLAGSLPMLVAGQRRLRAPLLSPSGLCAFQDKHQPSRPEREELGIAGGADPLVFETPWGRLGISLGYDLEFPKHARAQVEAGAWLVLAPASGTDAQGANRARFAAQARALENQCFVALAPAPGPGRAAVLGPVDQGFPDDGVLAEAAPGLHGWLFCTLDPARLAAVRQHGAGLHHQDWPRAPVAAPRPAAFS